MARGPFVDDEMLTQYWCVTKHACTFGCAFWSSPVASVGIQFSRQLVAWRHFPIRYSFVYAFERSIWDVRTFSREVARTLYMISGLPSWMAPSGESIC
jgi:hypothetical protein